MKISTPVKQFRESFAVAGRVVPSRTPNPILHSAKIVATERGVILLATDLDISIRHQITGVTADEPGEALLPKDLTDRILKSADDDVVSIELDGLQLRVRCGKARWSFTTESADLFPEPLSFGGDPWFTVDASDVVVLVKRTSYAVGPHSTRYALSGILVECEAGSVRFVATDGRRAATQVVSAAVGPRGPEKPPIIPARFAVMLAGLCKDGPGRVDFAFTGRHVVARVGGTVLGSGLVEGRFPAYRDVFPADADTIKIRGIDAESFGRALDQAAVTTSESSSGIDLRFDVGAVTLSSWDESGSSDVHFGITHDGPATGFTCAPRYLTDALKTFGSGSFDFGVVDHKSPVVIRTNTGFEGVVMPVLRGDTRAV